MLFHIKHTHTAELCPSHNPKLLNKTWGKLFSQMKNTEVQLLHAYINAPGHNIYLIVEADSAEEIEKFLFPVFKVGSAKVIPITDLRDTVNRFVK